MIKNLIVCLVMFFCSCHCFGDNKNSHEGHSHEGHKSIMADSRMNCRPPDAVVVEVMDSRWMVYKWRGM